MVEPASVRKRYSADEYLALERASPLKHELIDGEIVAMTGASRAHNFIVGDLFVSLRTALRGGPCEVFMSDMRVKVLETGLYVYPDIAVACGEIQMENSHADTLLNPRIIIEVLLPSTEAYDRGAKFLHYRKIGSLQAYVIVSQTAPLIELFTRQGEMWSLFTLQGLDARLPLAAIGVDVALRDIYERVEFAEAERLAP
ncbi:MAG: Uma2 family endonuclease [Chloroflexota bacterium]